MGTRKDERVCLPLTHPFFLGPATQTSDLGKGAVVKKKEGKEKREMNDNGGSLSFFASLFTA